MVRFGDVAREDSRAAVSGARFGIWRRIALTLAVVGVLHADAIRADERPLREVVDQALTEAWQREKLTPAERASDAEFLRRVSLDLIGVIPTHDETVAFLTDTTPTKRAALIDRLLADPRFAQHQADLWDLVLFGRNPPGYDTDKRDGIQNWLREQFAQNTPYDVWARQILKAEGNSVENGPPTFFMQYRSQPEDATEKITQTFLGVQLQCARCHDHPFEQWKQVDFYGLAAFLSRLEVVQVGKKDNSTLYAIAEKSTGDILFTGPAKEQMPGKKGDPVKPKFLQGDALAEPALPEGFKEVKFESNKSPPKPVFSRKDQLAEWVTDPTRNPFFARAIANRVWAQFFGRGIVHPVDNMSPANPPSHPELLDQLTAGLIAHKFDLKWFMSELCNSQAYQLSARSGSSDPLPRWFDHARWRPLSAEELVESWRVATGFDVAQAANPKSGDGKQKIDRFRPLGSGYMIRFFGSPNTGTGDFQGGLHEHLYLNNGPLGSVVASGKGSLLASLLDEEKTCEERVDRLYLSVLNRPPEAEERQKMVEYVSVEKQQAQDRWREAVWVLMTCSEFRFNH